MELAPLANDATAIVKVFHSPQHAFTGLLVAQSLRANTAFGFRILCQIFSHGYFTRCFG